MIRRFALPWLMFAAMLQLGCAPAVVSTPTPRKLSTDVGAEVGAPEPQSVGEKHALAPAETWDVVTMNGARVGSIHTVRERVESADRPLWRTTSTTRLEIKRFGQPTVQETRVSSVEGDDGELASFSSESALGAGPVTSQGSVEKGRLRMTLQVAGGDNTAEQPWDVANLGFDGVNKSLLRQPLGPGEKRSLKAMAPGLDKPLLTSIELAARDWEEVTLAGAKQRLLRVDAKQVLPGGAPLKVVFWCDETGDVLKAELLPGMIAERTTRDIALGTSGGSQNAALDLGFDTMVRVTGKRGDLHRARRVVYRVQLADGEPGEVFAECGTQHVAATDDPRVAQVTVVAADQTSAEFAPDKAAPSDSERTANLLVQSDDERIKALAVEAIGDATTAHDQAARLEKFVRGYIQQANFSQAFATAAEVAEKRRGDCTEYAVLLAALARASEIPSRVAVGLVYTHTAGEPGLAFHMWNELYVDGQWLPYDATLALGGAGPGHLKLSHSSLADGEALSSFLPVIQVMGRLNVEVLEIAERQ